MATTKRPSPSEDAPPRVRMLQRGEALAISRPLYVYRFLMADGAVVDVECDTDDSDVRDAVLKWTKGERIAGVTRMACVGWTTSE